jgi:acyl carrier protein
MTEAEIRSTVLGIVGEIAPEADLARIDPDATLRDQLDLDSMDVLNVMIALHEALQVDIPETDYAKLGSLNGAVAYLAQAKGAKR